jgi:hypothetical protein
MATARSVSAVSSAPCPAFTVATFWPTKTRRLKSSDSDDSVFSTWPLRIEADRDRRRTTSDIGLIGASGAGTADQTLGSRQQAIGLFGGVHVFSPFAWLSCIVLTVKHQARRGSGRLGIPSVWTQEKERH